MRSNEVKKCEKMFYLLYRIPGLQFLHDYFRKHWWIQHYTIFQPNHFCQREDDANWWLIYRIIYRTLFSFDRGPTVVWIPVVFLSPQYHTYKWTIKTSFIYDFYSYLSKMEHPEWFPLKWSIILSTLSTHMRGVFVSFSSLDWQNARTDCCINRVISSRDALPKPRMSPLHLLFLTTKQMTYTVWFIPHDALKAKTHQLHESLMEDSLWCVTNPIISLVGWNP